MIDLDGDPAGSDTPPVLEVRGLGKKLTSDLVEARRQGMRAVWDEIRLAGDDRGDRLLASEFWALRDVSFSVGPGEALGVIGLNGAGKSTLLRLLHGIVRPSAGSIVVRGRHVAMLELGAPFSQVLSGRENIVNTAAVYGLRDADVEVLIEEVAAFSELGEVLDHPMTTYSTGMQLRLGYAIAANLPSALLLVDEVIAVGDIGFQRKCLAHIRDHLARGGSLVLVSHDLWMIQALCDRCLVLDRGRVIEDGTANRAISTYLRSARAGQVHTPRDHRRDATAATAAPDVAVEIERCEAAGGGPIRAGSDLEVDLEVSSTGGPRRVRWRLDVLTATRQVCLGSVRLDDEVEVTEGDPVSVRVVVTDLPLLPGTFYLTAHVHDADTGEEAGSPSSALLLDVQSREGRLDTLAQLPGAGALSTTAVTYGQSAGAQTSDPGCRPSEGAV